MICPICKNQFFLAQKSVPVTGTAEDLGTAQNLEDTLRAHAAECIGMAANMIGVNKRIIAVRLGPAVILMLNPVILTKSGAYEAQEGCLSLTGTRTAKRFRTITAAWQDTAMNRHERQFTGLPAQIIQHECDHLDGILI